MRILHYFLGFPPYRSGGLTKFAFDLMRSQAAEHEVLALWPGRMPVAGKTPRFRRHADVEGIENWELVGPLPVPLDEGIRTPEDFMKACDPEPYRAFLRAQHPDVIHLHTLMGLHREMLLAAEELKIRTVMTTHDYFGICPKVTLFRDGAACEDDMGCRNCVRCNRSGLSLAKIRLVQSPAYRIAKDTALVKRLRKSHRRAFFEETAEVPETEPAPVSEEEAQGYRRLREYYLGMLSKISVLHYNSSMTGQVYERYVRPQAGRAVSITHRDIRDRREDDSWEPADKLRITYLAPAKAFKGYGVLKSALDSLWAEGDRGFTLRLFSDVPRPEPYMEIRPEGYDMEDLRGIFRETDILVMPSVWYETFGFTVLEALSYGVPVICSNHVGSGEIVRAGGIVVKAGDVQALKEAVSSLTRERLRELRAGVRETCLIKEWGTLLAELEQLYREE